MQVGQITFESEMGASGDDRGVLVGGEGSASLCATSRLLSCTPADLQAVLETRQISARMETYTVNLNKSEAEAARDALGKALYDKLFAWLVGRINVSTAPKDSSAVAATIGVLDIFGASTVPPTRASCIARLSLSVLCNCVQVLNLLGRTHWSSF